MNRQVKQAHELAEGDWLMIAGGNYQVFGRPTVDNEGNVVVAFRRHPSETIPCLHMSIAPDLIVIAYTK